MEGKEKVAGGVVGRWSRLDGGAHIAMISIPMLLTRRGWLGWATPYFLSLFLRLTSLHAPRPQFSLVLLPAPSDSLPILLRYFTRLFLLASLLPLFPMPPHQFPSIFPPRLPPAGSLSIPFRSHKEEELFALPWRLGSEGV